MNPFTNREGGGIFQPDDVPNLYVEWLTRRGMIKETGFTTDEIANRMVRASGLCECPDCGKNYYSHPYVSEARDSDGNPFLRVLCDGDIVKL